MLLNINEAFINQLIIIFDYLLNIGQISIENRPIFFNQKFGYESPSWSEFELDDKFHL